MFRPSQTAARSVASPHSPSESGDDHAQFEYLLLDAPRPPVRPALEPLWGLLLAHHARPTLRILLAARGRGLGRLRGLAEAVDRGGLVSPIDKVDPQAIATCRLVIAPYPPHPETLDAAAQAGRPVIQCFNRSSCAPWPPRELARTVLEYLERQTCPANSA